MLPDPLFTPVYSTLVLDSAGKLLGATIASDGQWRFPPDAAVPLKFRQALLQYEDRRFSQHPGVDPMALVRALRANLGKGSVVSGGSTITMQLMRLSRGIQERTLTEKVLEAILALRMELTSSKDTILRLYAAHAPFGGNVVGLEAAAWRYFGRSPDSLSWAETATLAVLPNSPALIHPGRNSDLLRAKRDRLLAALHRAALIEADDYQLALAEPLPEEPHDLPRLAPHFVDRIKARQQAAGGAALSRRVATLIDGSLQKRVGLILRRHSQGLAGNGIRHAAVLIVDVQNGAVVAYAGNSDDPAHQGSNLPDDGTANDMVFARRSTGSLLKPFLFAAQQDAGELLPRQLVPDIPTRFSGFVPENNTSTYSGAVPADDALARSLNVPAVRNLRSYGLHRFYDLLKTLGLETLFRPADLYGLPLIIGGAEGRLWDLTHMYADLARSLVVAKRNPGKEFHAWGRWPLAAAAWREDFLPAVDVSANGLYPFSPAAVYLTMTALAKVNRPEEEGNWESFLSSRRLSWKTGTSYGYRDAWAIGVNARYAVGVWVGNASGEGRPDLRGYTVAAPLLFDLESAMPAAAWFAAPGDLVTVEVCADSGYLAGPNCAKRLKMAVAPKAAVSQVCPYCRVIHLDPTGHFQATASEKMPVYTLRSSKFFVLPPDLEWYYRKTNAAYRTLPPFLVANSLETASAYAINSTELNFSLVFPEAQARIFVPIDIDGKPGMTIFQATHRDSKAVLYWHLDGNYLGSTREIHQIEARPGPGPHRLIVIDAQGRRLERPFTVLSR